jgi:1-acyl-sn-glycerol-3-phosphate acyltransferase
MERTWIFVLSRWLVMAVFKTYFRIEASGTENVPTQGPVILAPNHVSYLDPLWVSVSIKRPLRYMTWDKMTRLPLLGTLMQAYGAFPVNLEKGDRQALKFSLTHLKSGGGLVIFPEGARTRTGKTLPFKPGVVKLALDTQTPVVPVTIIGGYRAFSPYHFFPRPYKVKIIYHEPRNLALPDDETQAKSFMQSEAERLQKIVDAALPNRALAC